MKRFLPLFVLSVITVVSCNLTGKIITDTPVKTNILGIELCKNMTSDEVADSLTRNTENLFLSMPIKKGTIEVYRSFPMGLYFTYGGLSWSYVDVFVTNEIVYMISLVDSYESVENAKQKYDSAIDLFTQKYGKGNLADKSSTFWTDNVNTVVLRHGASSALDGSDRSFCELCYINVALTDKVNKENQPDI